LIHTVGLIVPTWNGISLAKTSIALRAGELLPEPDFTALHPERTHWAGIRPHRKGGARIELESAPISTANGEKYVAHNYGHGGCGITLSWGSAAKMVQLVTPLVNKISQEKMTVAIVGSGVIALTTATEILRQWPQISLSIYAKDLDVTKTTSYGAGGQFEPSVLCREYKGTKGKLELAQLLRASKDKIVSIQKSGERLKYGVAERKNYTLEHHIEALDDFTPRDVIAAPKTGALPFAKLNVTGREYDTWLMNPMKLLPALKADLLEKKISFTERNFLNRDELMSLPEKLIINCTGLGSKTLLADKMLIPQRGHLVRLKKTDDKQFYFFSGGCENGVISYAFCRQDDIVLGGTLVTNDEREEIVPADEEVFKKILTNSRELFGGQVKCLR
jgi:D-amino-acid oxidase